jgi:hypothetical protein
MKWQSVELKKFSNGGFHLVFNETRSCHSRKSENKINIENNSQNACARKKSKEKH